MTEPKCPASEDEVDLFDRDILECPYRAYEVLRNEAPVWQDPKTGLFVVTSFELVREVLLAPRTYLSGAPRRGAASSNREARMNAIYVTCPRLSYQVLS